VPFNNISAVIEAMFLFLTVFIPPALILPITLTKPLAPVLTVVMSIPETV